MNTIHHLSQYALQELKDSYSEHEIECICRIVYMDVLHYTNIDIHLRKNEILDESFINKFIGIVRLLKSGSPIQYILGETGFAGLRFKSTPSALIPRPETEELVRWVGEWLKPGNRLLDVGSGSGCIGISLARLCQGAHVTGVDISPEAIELARENAILNGVKAEFLLRVRRVAAQGLADLQRAGALPGRFGTAGTDGVLPAYPVCPRSGNGQEGPGDLPSCGSADGSDAGGMHRV